LPNLINLARHGEQRIRCTFRTYEAFKRRHADVGIDPNRRLGDMTYNESFVEDVAHYTALRPCMHGSFNLSRTEIPYIEMLMDLNEVTKELELVENLPSDLRSKWTLEELFQREIDWERVRTQLLNGYLKRANKIKFFNSITVALLPKNEKGMLDSFYGETPNSPSAPPGLDKEPWSRVDVGGIQIFRHLKNPFAYLRWDAKRIFPATIDGQHRLAALKELVAGGNLTKNMLETKISIIFLILDKRAGLSIDDSIFGPGENPILKTVREVFIDLNMNARPVLRSRQILLDDQEIESVCLRTLLAKRIGEDEPDKLPLGLVHWQHNVSAKFNTGINTAPFITTVELLNLIIRDLLDLDRPKDPLDENQVRKFIQSLEDSLRVSEHIKEHQARFPSLAPLLSYVEQHFLKEGFESPFVNPPPQYIRACADSFDTIWRPIFVRLLREFKPYKEFIAKVHEKGGIDGDLAFYLALPERAQKQQVEEWGESRPQKLDEPLADLAKLKQADWPFYAVFQKALFRATKNAFLHFDTLPPKKREKPFIEAWLAFLDELAERGLLAVKAKSGDEYIWAGIGINADNQSVRWSEAAVTRLSGILTLWWYFYMHELYRPGPFLKALNQSTAASTYPNGKKCLDSVIKGLTPVIKNSEREMSEKALANKIDQRLKFLIPCARSKSAKETSEPDADAQVEAAIVEVVKDVESGNEAT
jgi:hypothetical protein